MKTEARQILNTAAARLDAAGIDSARGDARLLLAIALGREDAVLPHEEIDDFSAECADRFDALIDRRLSGEPVSRIRGWREFWSLRFALSSHTLDPRPDSEILVEQAIRLGATLADADAERPVRCLDIGTGSGCLLLALLSEMPMATGIGIDISPAALDTAWENARALGLADRAEFAVRSFAVPADAPWPSALKFRPEKGFDLILSNPPYIPHAQISRLAPDVALYDPALALDGGPDGLDCWRSLLPRLPDLLSERGTALVEIGDGQRDDVVALAAAAGLVETDYFRDLAGTIRTLVFAPHPVP